MRRLIGMVCLVACASAANGQQWHALDGAAIEAALSDRSVTYDAGARQHFYASGRTLYTHGEPSWGSWRVENDRYCSLWPPSPDWDCYEVQGDGVNGVNFLDEWGNTFPGVVTPQ